MTWIPQIDNWIIVIGVMSGLSCALLGNYLVLRQMSMMGDAISHAVLPGLAGGFGLMLLLKDHQAILSWWPAASEWVAAADPRHPLAMFSGAVIVGLLTTVFTQTLHRFAQVDRGAAMGAVFVTLFAAGLILMEWVTADRRVDLDAGCVLYGAIELTPLDQVTLLGVTAPRAAFTIGVVLLLNLTCIVLFWKELKISSFDPALATTLGINATAMHYLLMTLTAITTVAAFEAIGSILVIAMLIVPAAAAHLLTDRMLPMMLVSLVVAAISAVTGHLAAITVPRWFGFVDTTTAGSMASMAGVIFVLVMIFAPRHGLVSRLRRPVEREMAAG